MYGRRHYSDRDTERYKDEPARVLPLKLSPTDLQDIRDALQLAKPSLENLKQLNSEFDTSTASRAASHAAGRKREDAGDSEFRKKFLQTITGSIDTKIADSQFMAMLLSRDPSVDGILENELQDKQESPHFRQMLEFRKKLPIFKKETQILSMIDAHQVVLISGETGCGKTTQVAQFILDDYILRGQGSLCHVVCTQPRRISAISVAERVAQERDDPCGSASVGYHIRLEANLPRPNGSILYCTTGMLLQFMRSDPGLRTISHLILDEIHERDVFCDFVLTILKDVIPKRPDLKIILMSATLNAEKFSEYFDNCPTIDIPGFTHPVKEFYLEDVLQMTGFRNFSEPYRGNKNALDEIALNKKRNEFENYILPYVSGLKSQQKYSDHVIQSLGKYSSEELSINLIESLIRHICNNEGEGAILVFLPGWNEISNLEGLLTEEKGYTSDEYLIIPLHSMLPTVTQKAVFEKPPPGVRKIVLSTNIAETSITINDVVYVIDCGKMKTKNFDAVNNVATLQSEWVSRANSRQRKGRAGRVQPGNCYHLFSRGRERIMTDYPLPEMLRTRLDEVILQIKILQLGKVEPFLGKVMNPPDSKVIALSLKLLQDLKALDEHENLTPLGFHLANLPLDPQIGKMIIMATIFSCIDPIFSIAASLSFKDPFVGSIRSEKKVLAAKLSLLKGHVSDHLAVAEAMRVWEELEVNKKKKFCRDHFLSQSTLYMLRDMKGQFAQYLREMDFLISSDYKAGSANINSEHLGLVKAIICAGLYPNIAIFRRVDHSRHTGKTNVKLSTREDGLVALHPKSVAESMKAFVSPFMAYHLKMRSSQVLLHDVTVVYPTALLFFCESIVCGANSVVVSDQICFSCSSSVAATLLKELRDQLDVILKHKITHPNITDWSERNFEAKLLRYVINLIVEEDKRMTVFIPEDRQRF
ncbi:ATP-dependent DNA/RNA helicase DHX36-like [Bacillus rossius redtenbacheri]|uniref:ATP-dependent DNA/RNA helicase DHX36-like n=1 Tax=Bacillus rossius redtenbacheri TaxID=93214 RepID=UPI002FDCBE6E